MLVSRPAAVWVGVGRLARADRTRTGRALYRAAAEAVLATLPGEVANVQNGEERDSQRRP